MKRLQYAAFLLACLMLLPAAAACGTADTQDTDNTPITDGAETTAAVTEADTENLEYVRTLLPSHDFGGHTFIVVDREVGNEWRTIDVYAEAENGDVINDAVFQRNMTVEEAFNIVITEYKLDPYDIGPHIRKTVSAGDESYDTFTESVSTLSGLAAENYLLDWTQISALQPEKPWWDPMMTSDCSIGNKIFFNTGDISIMDNYGTWCMLFNKDMVRDYDLGDVYAMVEDGTWTLDVMYDMAKTAARDLDGNGQMDDGDQWGFVTEAYNMFGLWASTGEKIAGKNADDLPVLSMYNERSAAAAEKIRALQSDTSVTMSAERCAGSYEFSNAIFKNNKALFMFGGLWLLSNYRDSEVNFGIIPAPKYDEAQPQYYTTYSAYNCTAFGIPTHASDAERTGAILEAMAMISRYTLTPAYYDKALIGKYIRDEESAGMLDIILASRNYDLGNIYNWGNLQYIFDQLHASQNAQFSSLYSASERLAQKQMEKFISKLNEQ